MGERTYTLRQVQILMQVTRGDEVVGDGTVHFEASGTCGISHPVGVPPEELLAAAVRILREVTATLEARLPATVS